MEIKIKPRGLNVLLEQIKDETETTKFGIIIPDSAKEKKPPVIAIVIAVGPDVVDVMPDDKVIFAEYGFDPINVDDKVYQIGPEEKILAILE